MMTEEPVLGFPEKPREASIEAGLGPSKTVQQQLLLISQVEKLRWDSLFLITWQVNDEPGREVVPFIFLPVVCP